MNRLGASALTRWIIGIVVGLFFLIPLVATLLYTFRAQDGSVTLKHWAALGDPAQASVYQPIWTGLGNSLVLAVVTALIVLLLLAPTMILVNLRFPRLRPIFEFAVLLPISIPAIVLVVGLTPRSTCRSGARSARAPGRSRSPTASPCCRSPTAPSRPRSTRWT